MKLTTIILAAGEGTRMKSGLPKVLHPLAGRPMVTYILEACSGLKPERQIMIVGHKHEQVSAVVSGKTAVVCQEKQLGSGHAVLVAEPSIGEFEGPILVLAGDVPLMRTETLKNLVDEFTREMPAAVIMTAVLENPFGYGRVIRNAAGAVARIVEEKDADQKQREIKEINAGIYCFDTRRLFEALARVENENNKGEYYLTDVVQILRDQGEQVLACRAEPEEILGVNSREELARVENIIQRRLKRKFMESGVTFVLPETTYLTADVAIEPDVNIWPNCFLEGGTKISRGAEIGPSARIINSKIGEKAKVQYAVLNGCEIEADVNVGPFCSIRPGTVLRRGSKAGTFVEIKESEVGAGSKVPHLSYIGDTIIGEAVNVGAGSITCNYDGINKHQTIIEDGAFIGSDTMMIAPVKIGREAVTGAGSSISDDVPPESLAVERSEQKIFPGWTKKRRERKS